MALRICLTMLAFLAVAQHAFSQSSLASQVLIVYSPTDPNSTAVAAHYQAARGIPNANLCGITAPTGYSVDYTDYVNLIRNPIRNCLTALGPKNILYIVLAYLRPLALQATATLTYSVDSFLADIWDQYTTQFFNPVPPAVHRYYAESQSQGNSFVPFQSLAAYRTTSRAQLIYSVWRLDGATPAVADAQVDSVMAATAKGGPPVSAVTGSLANACVDMTYLPQGDPDSAYTTANWDLYRVAGFLTAANNFNVVVDSMETSFGVGSSPDCLNTGLYAGWYNYGSYNNAFSWDLGSIGWDLDSGALVDTRSGPWWGTGAIAKGIAVTSGPMAEPYLEGIARPAVVLSLLEGANVGDAFLRNTRWLKWMILNVGDPLYQPFPGGVAPFNATLAANSIAVFLNQSTFRQYVGGVPLAVNVSLASPAPANGLTVTLTTNASGVAFPTSLTIPGGETSAIVAGTTTAVTAESDVQLTATAGSISATNTISVYPLLSGVGFATNPAVGGGTLQATIGLNSNAPLGGAVVQLSSNTPSVAAVPASVTVPAGLTQASFNITTSAVTANTMVNITSSYAGASNTAALTVEP
jgi:uncharacterized protein (TIGR03790 family)